MKKKILFICTHNSARSQIAEGFIKSQYGEQFEAFSAGTKPTKVSPYAIRAMLEIGIDISKHQSKSVNNFEGIKFDYVITVCAQAKESCPFFPGAKFFIHKSFEDPSSLEGTEEEIMENFRKAREQIREWIVNEFVKWNED
ncbi:ArsC family transcriptional regulator [Candidatus Bathyarchaeota archaeon RBG_13_38_9]|nr:MAG: ArsC family transcriptional regulator [Candidatus Bathyarchaeota archaeon RBG_13_38_9]